MKLRLQGGAAGVLLAAVLTQAACCCRPGEAADRPVGIEQRVRWTTSRVQGSPDPPAPYRLELAFPKLRFAEPLEMTAVPGSHRLLVVERYGKVFTFPNDRSADRPELFLDLGKVIYGFAFHPRFDKTGVFFLTYLVDPREELPKGTRLSRFRVDPGNPLKGDSASEQVLLEWPSGGHNGGCLVFGPDGYLYIGTGDSSGINDDYLTGQDLSVLPAKILRIDVDRPDPGKPYGIPKDNPFVETPGARPETWAYGLRQPWKMSFDRQTGAFWAGNVGQDLWEQIYRIEKGGNYGWSVYEGSQPFRPERTRGPTPILMPVVEHDHANFRSITGGFVYRGRRWPELAGAYIYGDYDTGRIWMFRYADGKVSDQRELLDSTIRLVGFAEDHAGELYLIDHMGGGIHQLLKNPPVPAGAAFPRRLSQTGLFTSLAPLRPAPGVIGYSIIAPAWIDGAQKEFHLALPGDAQIEFETIEFPQPSPGVRHGWKFPNGAVLVETISVETAVGKPGSRRPIETRILHNERLAGTEEVGDQYWRGYSFAWNDEQTDAELVEPAGRDLSLTIVDQAAPGGRRTLHWRIPSRAECTVCHNLAAKFAIAANTMQLNREHDYGGVRANQLRTFEHIGLFTKPLPEPPEKLPGLVDYWDERHSIERRARSYLHANCSYCHRKWGGGNADFRLLYPLELAETLAVEARPAHGAFFIPDAKVVAPADPYRSVLYFRMAKLGPGHMPRMGAELVDPPGLRLIHDWIAQLPPQAGAGGPQGQAERLRTERLRQHTAELLERLHKANAPAEREQTIDQLLATTSGALTLVHVIDAAKLRRPIVERVVAKAAKHSSAPVRDLFERFLPEDSRTRRLTALDPVAVLAAAGDAGRGRALFFQADGLACRTCHRIKSQGDAADAGGEVGPDLSEIAKKYSKRQLLETITQPSKEIDPKYLTYVVQTLAGLVHTGVLVERTAEAVVLRDAQNQLVRIPAGAVEQLAAQRQSLMPELLLRDLTLQQAADLLEFLSTLK